MATIDSKEIIDVIIKNNGYYEDDVRVHSIVRYTNAYGNITYGVTWVNEMNKTRYLIETEYVRCPEVIWHSDPDWKL